MPTKNITLGPGDIYIDGVKMNGLNTVNMEVDEDVDLKEVFPMSAFRGTEFTFEINMTLLPFRERVLIFGFWRAVWMSIRAFINKIKKRIKGKTHV